MNKEFYLALIIWFLIYLAMSSYIVFIGLLIVHYFNFKVFIILTIYFGIILFYLTTDIDIKRGEN